MKEQLKADPFPGAIYVFRSKRADRVKLLFRDGSGACLFNASPVRKPCSDLLVT